MPPWGFLLRILPINKRTPLMVSIIFRLWELIDSLICFVMKCEWSPHITVKKNYEKQFFCLMIRVRWTIFLKMSSSIFMRIFSDKNVTVLSIKIYLLPDLVVRCYKKNEVLIFRFMRKFFFLINTPMYLCHTIMNFSVNVVVLDLNCLTDLWHLAAEMVLVALVCIMVVLC